MLLSSCYYYSFTISTMCSRHVIILGQYSIELSIPTKLTLESEVSILWYWYCPSLVLWPWWVAWCKVVPAYCQYKWRLSLCNTMHYSFLYHHTWAHLRFQLWVSSWLPAHFYPILCGTARAVVFTFVRGDGNKLKLSNFFLTRTFTNKILYWHHNWF